MVSTDYIREKIMLNIECVECQVEVGEDETKFSAQIVSDSFSGKSLLQRHRMIYDIFTEEMKGPIHALSLTTLTSLQLSQLNK